MCTHTHREGDRKTDKQKTHFAFSLLLGPRVKNNYKMWSLTLGF